MARSYATVGQMMSYAIDRSVSSPDVQMPRDRNGDVELLLRRQYNLKEDQLFSFFDTQVAIDGLPARYRQAVVQYWRAEGQGWSMREHARHNRPGLHHDTFAGRLRKGHVLLREAFNEAAARRRAQVDAQSVKSALAA